MNSKRRGNMLGLKLAWCFKSVVTSDAAAELKSKHSLSSASVKCKCDNVRTAATKRTSSKLLKQPYTSCYVTYSFLRLKNDTPIHKMNI